MMNVTPSKIKKGFVILLTIIDLGLLVLLGYSFTQGTETGVSVSCCFGPVMLLILLISAWLMGSANKDELVEKQLERERRKK